MTISLNTSAISLINTAQYKAADAAQALAKMPTQDNEVGSANFNSTDLIKPVLSLKESELETSAAVKLLEADKETIGSLLDIKA